MIVARPHTAATLGGCVGVLDWVRQSRSVTRVLVVMVDKKVVRQAQALFVPTMTTPHSSRLTLWVGRMQSSAKSSLRA